MDRSWFSKKSTIFAFCYYADFEKNIAKMMILNRKSCGISTLMIERYNIVKSQVDDAGKSFFDG